MSYNVINPYQTFYDSTGEVRSAGIITFYKNRTTTLAAIYSDEALTVAQNNPYTLDAYGRITGDVKFTDVLTMKIQNADLSDIRTDDDVASLKGSSIITTVATKALAAALSLAPSDAGRKVFVTSPDGGEFTVRYNATPATYADNGGAYCGTIFIPTGGDGTIGIERDYTAIYAEMFGAKGDDSTDDTASLNTALTVSKNLGFPLRIRSVYKVTDSLLIYDGARLLGDMDSVNNTGGGGSTGAVIKNYGTNPAIKVLGATTFELAHFHITSDTPAAEHGIYLDEDGGNVPRKGWIHNMSIKGVGGDGIRLNAFSYVKIEQVSSNGNANGISVVNDTVELREYLYVTHTQCDTNTGNGVNIDVGSLMYFTEIDSANNDKGLYIHGSVFGCWFNRLSVARNDTYSIEIYADTDNLDRLTFTDTFMHLDGVSAAEKGLYTHQASSFVLTRVKIDDLDITKNGATTPTLTIDVDTSFADCEITDVRNTTGGGVSFPTTQPMKYTNKERGFEFFTDGDTTPSVLGGENFELADTTANIITDFDDPYRGQKIYIHFPNNNTTIQDGSPIQLAGNVDFVGSTNDTLTLWFTGFKWLELSRGVN